MGEDLAVGDAASSPPVPSATQSARSLCGRPFMLARAMSGAGGLPILLLTCRARTLCLLARGG